jgi:DNA-binding beta-propeller fold protein YncE
MGNFKLIKANQLRQGNQQRRKPVELNVYYMTFYLALVVLSTSFETAVARPQFKFENIISLSTGSAGQTRPVSVTWDPVHGEICITDVRQASLYVINPFDIELFHTSTVAHLSMPSDGSIDQQGRMVCVDRTQSGLNTIIRLNVFGEPDPYTCEIPNQEWNPRHLLVTQDGHYLTLDPNSALLAKHNHETGQLIWKRTIAKPLEEDLYLGRPAEDGEGLIYVPGGNLRKILVLQSDGKFLSSFGKFGSAEGYFSFPVAVSFSPEGSLMVLDRMRHKIIVFDQEHNFIAEFGSMGAAPGQFYHPVAMATDAGGRVFVAQGFQGRVQVFRMTETRP